MKPFCYIFVLLALSAVFTRAQTVPYRSAGKWGIRENGKVLISPVYDTIFNFDSTGRVCMGCFRTRDMNKNSLFRVTSTIYTCNYLNKKNKRLVIRVPGNDTCSVFSLSRRSPGQLNDKSPYFVVTVKTDKFLVDKNFSQLTFRPYYNIETTIEPAFFMTEIQNEAEMTLSGLMTLDEKIIVPHRFSHIRINPFDSLIIACSAGLPGSEDVIFDYGGKKLRSSHRHIHTATRNFVIHKIFEPREYFVISGKDVTDEIKLEALEVEAAPGEELLIRTRKEQYLYNLHNRQKKQIIKTSHGKNQSSN